MIPVYSYKNQPVVWQKPEILAGTTAAVTLTLVVSSTLSTHHYKINVPLVLKDAQMY